MTHVLKYNRKYSTLYTKNIVKIHLIMPDEGQYTGNTRTLVRAKSILIGQKQKMKKSCKS